MSIPKDLNKADISRLEAVLQAADPVRYAALCRQNIPQEHARVALLRELRKLPAIVWRDWKN